MKANVRICAAMISVVSPMALCSEDLPVYDIPRLGELRIDGKAEDWGDSGFRPR